MSIQLQTLNWSPIIEGKKAVVFVTTAMVCDDCAFAVLMASDTLVDQEGVDGGQRGNVHWRSKGKDVADECELCGISLPERAGQRMGEELRFWVEVQ